MQSVSAAPLQLRNVPGRSPYAAATLSTPVTAEVVPPVQSQPEPYIHHAQQAALGGGRRALVLAICCSALFMVGLDNTIVIVGLPSIGASLDTCSTVSPWDRRTSAAPDRIRNVPSASSP